jgi:altronate dehydratase
LKIPWNTRGKQKYLEIRQSSLKQMGEKVFHSILETASGVKTKNEIMGIGDHEFILWRIGPIL